MKRKAELDLIIIETTGLANPGPVAQTFFADEAVNEFARLDGIITMVDAKHVEQHLDDEKEGGAINEATEQVAFADRLLLNKIDLVPEEGALRRVEARLRMQRCRSNSRRAGWRQVGRPPRARAISLGTGRRPQQVRADRALRQRGGGALARDGHSGLKSWWKGAAQPLPAWRPTGPPGG